MEPTPRRKRRTRRRNVIIASALTTTLTLSGAAAWAADRYLVQHVEIDDVAAYEAENSPVTVDDGADDTGDDEASTETVLTDTSYTSGETSVEISTVVEGSGD